MCSRPSQTSLTRPLPLPRSACRTGRPPGRPGCTRCSAPVSRTRLPAEAQAALEEQARAQQEQEENRFNQAPNPFDRGPEMTETRLARHTTATGPVPAVDPNSG